MGDVGSRIRKVLQESMQPKVIEVKNQSARHKGHAGDDGSGESHFYVVVVSNVFKGKSRIERHRMIFSILQKELGILPHALSIKALAEDE